MTLRSKLPALRPARAPFKRTLTLALYAHLAFASLAQAVTTDTPVAPALRAASQVSYTPGTNLLP